ncbi:MAG: exosortase/archaeosortase family protein [Candidatus Diapherotrites archaeon]
MAPAGNGAESAEPPRAEELPGGALKISELKGKKNFWESANFRAEALRGLKFLAGTAVVFAALHFLFLLVVPLANVELFYANLALFFAGFFGVNGNVQAFSEPVLIFAWGKGLTFPISVSYLCTGLLEMLLLVAAVAASFGIEIRKRALGIAGAVAATVLFNLLRITASILLIVFYGLGIAEIGHEILFRLFLFVTVAGYYTLWFWWATGQAPKALNKIFRKSY